MIHDQQNNPIFLQYQSYSYCFKASFYFANINIYFSVYLHFYLQKEMYVHSLK